MTDSNNDRIGTHWATCWRDGGRRHYACAVAEAERQIARAEAAEAKLGIKYALVDAYAQYYRLAWAGWEIGADSPLSFGEWLAAGKPKVKP